MKSSGKLHYLKEKQQHALNSFISTICACTGNIFILTERKDAFTPMVLFESCNRAQEPCQSSQSLILN